MFGMQIALFTIQLIVLRRVFEEVGFKSWTIPLFTLCQGQDPEPAAHEEAETARRLVGHGT